MSKERTQLLEFIEVDRLLLDNWFFVGFNLWGFRFLKGFWLGLFWFYSNRYLFLLPLKLWLTLLLFGWLKNARFFLLTEVNNGLIL